MNVDMPLSIREATADELARWDEIVSRFPACRVVHRRAWLRSLEASGLGRPLYFVYERGSEIVACLPGLVTNVGPLRLFGSPMAGWQSVSMGPVFDPERATAGELIQLLVPLLEGQYRVDHIEIISCTLGDDAMGEVGFRGEEMVTYRAALTPTEPRRTFRAMKESARRNVKRATQLGLTVRLGIDETFVDEHYSQIKAVFARGGNVVPFGRGRLASFVRNLDESGNLIAASVFLPDGATRIATATFTIDGPELLLWMWAHDVRYRWYRPTELMTWTIMEAAMARGCTTLDFMGRGDFKAVFGAHPEGGKRRWVRSRRVWITWARDLAGFAYRLQQAVRGRIARWRLDDDPAAQPQASVGAAAGEATGVEQPTTAGVATPTNPTDTPPRPHPRARPLHGANR